MPHPASSVCPVCSSTELTSFLEVGRVPAVCNQLWPTRTEALAAPTGDIELALCGKCGMILNVLFDPAAIGYGPRYENSLHFSSVFQEYASDLARRLVRTHSVTNGTVVEIGSGKGDFLTSLCKEGDNMGIGYDPSYAGEADAAATGSIRFVPALWDGDVAKADLVCCRQVLEHLEAPRELVDSLAQSIAPESVVYFEVPDAAYMLGTGAIYDVIYEHYSYFSAAPMKRLFIDAGFEILTCGSSFGDQYLFLEARRARGVGAFPPPPPAHMGELASGFQRRFRTMVESWGQRLHELAAAGRKAALWGSGSKGVTFLNIVPGADRIDSVVDINTRKHGHFIPGTGQQIVSPEALREAQVDYVILLNPLYRTEVGAHLASLGLSPELLTDDGRGHAG